MYFIYTEGNMYVYIYTKLDILIFVSLKINIKLDILKHICIL